jgi:hypothetical protein
MVSQAPGTRGHGANTKAGLLLSIGKPVQEGELFGLVEKHRALARRSMGGVLNQDPRFVRIGRATWTCRQKMSFKDKAQQPNPRWQIQVEAWYSRVLAFARSTPGARLPLTHPEDKEAGID